MVSWQGSTHLFLKALYFQNYHVSKMINYNNDNSNRNIYPG